MHYMLECHGLKVEQASLLNVPEFAGVSWISGSPITVKVPEPIEVDLDTSTGDYMLPMLEFSILLMSNEMINVLNQAGVDNLEIFEARIKNPHTGIARSDYSAVNIVGKVACADLSASTFQAHDDEPLVDADFDGLVIDPEKARNLLIFRLAECVTGIVIHESIKSALDSAGIENLDFVLPENWIG